MCGRYVLAQRPSVVRQRLAKQNMPADEAPSDDDPQIRQSYNFAPGYHGLIYRAATNDRGTDATPYEAEGNEGEPSPKKAKLSHSEEDEGIEVDGQATRETKYKLQSAKWGLIPFWTKRAPDYGSMMRTINCRDDSLAAPSGMWTTMKQRKRCIVVAEGFFEWLKKNNGKEKIPHYIKRKDGGLMCFAGLWDCVKYEDTGKEKEGEGMNEKLYTYTVITTDSNKQISWLHDRMPVILEPGSEEMRLWLDPHNVGWNKELQSILKPFKGELEIYPVDQAVGKVGNNSPNFVIPVDSKENKKNIANFFGNQKAKQSSSPAKKEDDEARETSKDTAPESNAPLPKPPSQSDDSLSQAIEKDTTSVPDSALLAAGDESTDQNIKHEADEINDDDLLEAEKSPPRQIFNSPSKQRQIKLKPSQEDGLDDKDLLEAEKSPPQQVFSSPSKKKPMPSTPSKTRDATRNVGKEVKSPAKGGSDKKITAFFGGKT
jgi:putative SOS response-associated peptidase YedK